MKPDNDSSNPSAPAVNEHANSEADRRVKQIASTKQKTVITLGSWDRREDERTQIFVLDWNQSRTLAARAEARARSCSSLSPFPVPLLSLPLSPSCAALSPLSLLLLGTVNWRTGGAHCLGSFMTVFCPETHCINPCPHIRRYP
jgi:hypothetical protein